MRVARPAWVLVAGVLLAGCASPGRTPARPDLLFLSKGSGLLAVDGSTGGTVLDAGYAAGDADRRRVYVAANDGRATRLSVRDLATGRSREVARVPGTFVPSIVSNGGDVALTEPRPAGRAVAWDPARRSRTVLAIVSSSGEVRRFDLNGNFSPEAFTVDGRTLVLLEYLPALRPDRYRLRELDVSDGSVAPLGLRVKRLAPDEMRATGRTQVAAPGGAALYTLYARQGPNLTHLDSGSVPTPGPAHSFVHVLNLVQGFAHCVDLPDGFGTGPAAIALSPGGDALYAVDAGRAIEVDAHALRVARSVPLDTAGLRPTGAAVSDHEIFVGSGAEVVVLDRGSLSVVRGLALPGAVKGLALSPGDHGVLYAVLEDEVAVIDAGAGVVLRSFAVPGAGGVLAAIPRPAALEAIP